ncbi:hypothetical protein BP6252_09112 [Coleophoma cylindrospora]|uniref:Heterokaryon incompatibility domain-containing protein n=1 Tax=Coleophoma cylindrospora TaxID=1849047 RepID=A0A3D8R117_9HELO|nr:hypothetical protein BP6252_09112 [Coleophoma cylindrospora]
MTGTQEGLEAFLSREGYQHHDEETMLESAQSGCPVCQLLLPFRPRPEYYRRDGPQGPISYRVSADVDRQHPGCDFYIRSVRLNGHQGDTMQIKAFTTHEDPAASFLDVLPLSVPVTGSGVENLVKAKLESCLSSHTKCPRQGQPPLLPTRVIDVGSGSQPPSLRLRLSSPGQRAPYLALSYCWGGPQQLTTTTTTLAANLNALPGNQLPRTIEDAVTVTRRLGFRYLWVDALCIIQDDEADKLAEIGAMGGVYKNATLTMAAADSPSVKHGFLEDRPVTGSCFVPLLLPNGKLGKIWLRATEADSLKGFALDSRAWTLQESLLSPRLLSYTPKDLIWKCQMDRSESIAPTHAFYIEASLGVPYRLPTSVFGVPHPSEEPKYTPQSIWMSILLDYTKRALSFPEDRLLALSGIASELQIAWGDIYLAGVWQSCLVQQLCWYRLEDECGQPLNAPRNFPSWSWASFHGPLHTTDLHEEDAKFLEASTELVDKNSPFGNVHGGQVVLDARFFSKDAVEASNLAFNMDIGPDGVRTMDEKSKIVFLGWDDEESVEKDGSGLILSPAGNGCYRRIGHFSAWDCCWEQALGHERHIIKII